MSGNNYATLIKLSLMYRFYYSFNMANTHVCVSTYKHTEKREIHISSQFYKQLNLRSFSMLKFILYLYHSMYYIF